MGSGLGDLQVYRNALLMSERAWQVYEILPKHLRFDIGSQFLRAIDSIGANIAEGYGRYHYKDKIKFYYNARGSLWDAKHWLYLLKQRKLVEEEYYEMFMQLINATGIQLNNFIKSTGKLADGR
ncbi:four helix bundle protein [Hydrogenimonas sp.]